MYTLAVLIQYIGIVAVIVGFLYVFPKRLSKRKQLLLLILVSAAINDIGYLFELQSTTVEAALVSIKVAYVGKLVAELAIFIFVLEYTNIKIPALVKVVLGVIHAYVISLVWTCEDNTLYYSKIEYTEEGLYPHVVLGHGIVYNLFTVMTFSYMAIIFIVCVTRFVQAKSVAQRMRMICLCTPPITFVVGLLIFKSGIAQGYDATAVSYLICAIIFVYTMAKHDLMEESEIVTDMILDEFSEAVIVFDNNNKIFYVNDNFKEIYPNYLDNQELQKLVISCAQSNNEFQHMEKYYHVIAKEIIQEKISLGVMYVFHDITEEHKRIELVNNYNRNLQYDVEMKTKSIVEMQNQLVLGMADMVEGRDANTGGHIKRTSQVIKILVEKMRADKNLQVDREFYDYLVKAAPMHDLGKIAVDDAILRKPGKFTPEEYDEMKKHAEKGAVIVARILESIEDREFARIAENVAHYHHERFDGAGYPEHLKGDAIPFEARIMAIADVYDALVSKRCYKDKMSFEQAFQIIEDGMGSQFDIKLEPYFVASREELEKYYSSIETDNEDKSLGKAL